jgi:hypothetical protein
VNAEIFERHRNLSVPEVLGTVRASHRAARARLATLGDHAVAGAVADVLPPGAAEGGGDPAAPWIAGNTWEHYEAHHDWIRALVAGR